MTIRMYQLFIYTPSPPTSLDHFVEFWAERYHYPIEDLYRKNINGPHTPESLGQLFRWKIGNRDFASKHRHLKENFIDRRREAVRLMKELDTCEPREIARRFLAHFTKGGAIYRIFWLHCWRIFWLHCWNTRFPIYDQHVHRAMTFIKDDGEMEELAKFKPDKQVQLYLDRYLPFFDEFRGMDRRSVDKALWRFGKSLQDRSLPPLRSPS